MEKNIYPYFLPSLFMSIEIITCRYNIKKTFSGHKIRECYYETNIRKISIVSQENSYTCAKVMQVDHKNHNWKSSIFLIKTHLNQTIVNCLKECNRQVYLKWEIWRSTCKEKVFQRSFWINTFILYRPTINDSSVRKSYGNYQLPNLWNSLK